MLIGHLTYNLPTNERFGTDILLRKYASGIYIDGIYSPGAPFVLPVKASVQPASDDDRLNLPAGERIREAKTIWIKTNDPTLVRPVRQGTNNTPGDAFEIGGIVYEIYSVKNYGLNGHIKCVCMRVEDQDG